MATIYLILATYAITLIITSMDGPYGIFLRLRRNKRLGALHCFTCTSVWVGALLALYGARNVLEWVVLTLALAGGAIAIDRLTMEGI